MDDDEQERVLYRIDERTEQIQKDIKRIERRQRAHEKEIDQLQAETQHNSNSIKAARAFLGVVGAALAAISAKITGLFAA